MEFKPDVRFKRSATIDSTPTTTTPEWIMVKDMDISGLPDNKIKQTRLVDLGVSKLDKSAFDDSMANYINGTDDYLAKFTSSGKKITGISRDSVGLYGTWESGNIYDYTNGVLITTTIDTTSRAMISLLISGVNYRGLVTTDTLPNFTFVQTYLQQTTGNILSSSGFCTASLDTVYVFKRLGKICFWHRQDNSSSTYRYKITLSSSNPAMPNPRMVFTDEACPTDTTKPVMIACKTLLNSYNYSKYALPLHAFDDSLANSISGTANKMAMFTGAHTIGNGPLTVSTNLVTTDSNFTVDGKLTVNSLTGTMVVVTDPSKVLTSSSISNSVLTTIPAKQDTTYRTLGMDYGVLFKGDGFGQNINVSDHFSFPNGGTFGDMLWTGNQFTIRPDTGVGSVTNGILEFQNIGVDAVFGIRQEGDRLNFVFTDTTSAFYPNPWKTHYGTILSLSDNWMYSNIEGHYYQHLYGTWLSITRDFSGDYVSIKANEEFDGSLRIGAGASTSLEIHGIEIYGGATPRILVKDSVQFQENVKYEKDIEFEGGISVRQKAHIGTPTQNVLIDSVKMYSTGNYNWLATLGDTLNFGIGIGTEPVIQITAGKAKIIGDIDTVFYDSLYNGSTYKGRGLSKIVKNGRVVTWFIPFLSTADANGTEHIYIRGIPAKFYPNDDAYYSTPITNDGAYTTGTLIKSAPNKFIVVLPDGTDPVNDVSVLPTCVTWIN